MSVDDGRAGLVVLAVDDERPALAELKFLLEEQPTVARVYTASDATDALRVLRGPTEMASAGPGPGQGGRCPVDVVYLDIGMPGLDGLELAKLFGTFSSPPAVVFVTGYEHHAVEAYDIGAVDYLMKPLRVDRLAESLRRVARTLRTSSEAEDSDRAEDEVIPVELAGTTKLVPRSTVRYVEAQGDYARLHTAEGSHLVRIPLSVLEEKWADAGFVRIHRSYLVSLPLVTELRMASSGYVVRIGGGPDTAELPVSRRHTRELKDRLVRAAKQAWNQR
jgi:DNA-binding LytR/AlgR family response regulator